jgi:hypothetical protein
MVASRIARTLTLLLLSVGVAAAGTVAPRGNGAQPARTSLEDASQRVDANHVSMVVKNTGSFAYDTEHGAAGLEFPKGSGLTAVFACGLWLGALVDDGVRVSVAEYSDDYRPGAVIGSGAGAVPDDPLLLVYKVYKLKRIYPDGSGGIDVPARDAALTDYNAGAVPHGAPTVSVLGDGTLSIVGDQMLWSVYNDLGKGAGHNSAGSRLPLGVEVQQTTWAYDHAGPSGNSVFSRFKIINRGPSTLKDMRVAFWSDPDLGGFSDDLVGCDSTRSLGFCYNATNSDAQYGATPPAVGLDLLKGPLSVTAGGPLQLTAFTSYTNGTDLQDSVSTFHSMQGLQFSGAPILDPLSNPTHFMFAGDPVQGTGWNDAAPKDKRMLLSSGPFTMAPNDGQEVVLGIVLARGTDRLNSVGLLKYFDDLVQTAFDAGALDLLAVPPAGRARLSLERPWPNPARGPFSVTFSLPAEGDASLELVDIAGRRVFQRSLGVLAPGAHTVRLDAVSARIPSGIYFVRLTHGRASVARRVALMR